MIFHSIVVDASLLFTLSFLKGVVVSISGHANIAQHKPIINDNDIKELIKISTKYSRVRINSFLIKGRLTYYQYLQFQQIGDIKELEDFKKNRGS